MIQLELALESIESGGHYHDFLVIERFGSPSPFTLELFKLALG